mgnify:FL=1
MKYSFTKIALNINILFLVGILFFFSCKESENYPVVPQLTFESFTNLRTYAGIDTMGIMILSFTDGDGDLGLADYDTSTNFFVKYFVMNNGLLEEGTRYNPVTGQSEPINFNVRIPNLAPDNYKGWLKGQIEDTISPLRNATSSKTWDTVMFRAWIFDRAGNKSNEIETPLILVKNQ